MNDCIFCKIIKGDIPSKKVYEDDNVIAFMDINPQVDGHTLVVPKKHLVDFTELESKDLDNIFNVAKKLTPMLMKAVNAEAFTSCYNYGNSQEVKHFHLHLLPNYGVSLPKTNIEEVYDKIKEIEI